MSSCGFYEMCQRYHGRAVMVQTKDGGVYRGYIREVDRRQVVIEPIGRPRGLGGFGYGGFGFRGYGFGGYGYGGFYRIALGAIAGIALVSLFFW
ncbi:hypothetical protein HMPREF9372_0898 [Sporosarcina newyorkensis 2681]|uniref:Uncharacterized protein n=1 Tax=Sporosarcina newyorkensis 2681 TaxID=1027292 RepID=F9DQ18_9BACL|nr:hypothetical protein [Sporosarcina newyorkensis]EGQ27211.1 hypothetical protein HMPREF9372_0898 [Sporosarcina newyorkensis 2681]